MKYPVERVIEALLSSDEPSVRYKVKVEALKEKPESDEVMKLREDIRSSKRVRMLLSERGKDGKIPYHPYRKWRGSHWVLTLLAELGYPSGDRPLKPMVDQACSWALRLKAQVIRGRARRCASKEGNALLYMIRLGFLDQRCDELAERLIGWQWPDGGWNCDRRPEAFHSSFHESLIPMRALNAYAQSTGGRRARAVVKMAGEMFLERRLFRRKTTGEVIRPSFAMTHYPYFWRYNFLHGLRTMAEAGLINDPRCGEALDLLESKQLPNGGFPAERKYYRVIRNDRKKRAYGTIMVGWGPTSTDLHKRSNDFVTAEALAVLKAAGRIK